MDKILERIHKAALRFLEPLNLQETYKVVVDEAVKLVDGQYGTIMLLENNELIRVYSSVPQLFDVETSRHGPFGNDDLRYKVIEKKNSIVLTPQYFKFLKKNFPALKVFEDRGAIMIPLTNRSKTIGVLSVISLKNSEFSGKQLQILKLFGGLASLAIKKTQLYNETVEALETRDLFISMASHELRTPLTTINGYSQLLHSKFKDNTTNEGRWVEGLASECHRLTLLVKELLQINQIRAGELHYYLKECHLRDIISRSITSFHFTNPHRKAVFEDKLREDNDIVIADFDKLLQVMNNLLENAAKFSDTEKEVLVTLKHNHDNYLIEIRDYGRGIPKKDLSRIFEGFYRGSTEKEGMGLGLYLAKDIINRLHGDIKVSSKENKGTVFQVCLPKYNR